MKKIKIINVVGARPNFMKIAPLQREMDKYSNIIEYKLVHTGQHYDENMSGTFFKDLNIRKPDYYLNVGSGTHGEQTGKIMIEFEKILLEEKPDLVLVAGDVNSTIACALDAVKLHIKVGHIEAGCRSFDRKMPEEINRILTDSISDYLFALDEKSIDNLKNEGIPNERIFLVGDIMLDSLEFALSKMDNNSELLSKLKLSEKEYCVTTLHRPSNVDSKENLEKILDIIKSISEKINLVFPMHPRTLKNFNKYFGDISTLVQLSECKIIEPLGYFDFIDLFSKSKFVLTDSGSLQQETTYLNIPCLTMRDSTERPITIEKGTNELVYLNKEKILKYIGMILDNNYKKTEKIDYWDGKTSERILKKLCEC